jgi:hypothetical protein
MGTQEVKQVVSEVEALKTRIQLLKSYFDELYKVHRLLIHSNNKIVNVVFSYEEKKYSAEEAMRRIIEAIEVAV